MPDPAMRDWRVIFGKNVRRARLQKGLTQEQAAFEADIDLTYMGGIERGKRNPISCAKLSSLSNGKAAGCKNRGK